MTKLIARVLNEILEAQVSESLGAEFYERSEQAFVLIETVWDQGCAYYFWHKKR